MIFPRLPYQNRQHTALTVALRGINLTDNYTDGQLADSKNISSSRYPYFTTRNARERMYEEENVKNMASWNALIRILDDGSLMYGDTLVAEAGTFDTAITNRQFAVLNTKVVIWPDKKFIDLQNPDSPQVYNLEAQLSSDEPVTFTKKTLEISGNHTTTFSPGDAITIRGCSTFPANNRDTTKAVRILSCVSAGGKTVFTFDIAEGATYSLDGSSVEFDEGTERGSVVLERKIPDMDFICESDNRLWGCSNATKTIYCSALGLPQVFYDYYPISASGSYAVAVGSEGDFTGCISYSSSVLFFKENMLHKMLGSSPSEYQMYTYTMEGVHDGCHKSLLTLNNRLFYLGPHGVYVYSGGSSSSLSYELGSRTYEDGAAGTDGKTYYLSCNYSGRQYLFTYDFQTDVWLIEDDTAVKEFARQGNNLYFLTSSGEIYLTDTKEPEDKLDWYMTFKPIYETISGAYRSRTILFEKKRYSRLVLRVELAMGSFMRIECRFDGKGWQDLKTIPGGTEGIAQVMIPIARCDKYELRLSGNGRATLLGIEREFSTSGVK